MGLLQAIVPSHPPLLGEHAVGAVRTRLPNPSASEAGGLLAQVHYPTDSTNSKDCTRSGFPYFRPEVISSIAANQGVPKWALASILGRTQLDPTCPPKRGPGRGWPIVVFSSGLWGSVEMYTTFCRQLASNGMVVVAIEHEDGSGVFAQNARTGDVIPFAKAPPDSEPKTFRHLFIERRADELGVLEATLVASCSGDAAVVQGQSEDTALLSRILATGDSQQLLIIGHSFGCCGIVRYLRRLGEQQRDSAFCGALLVDLWGGPLTDTDCVAPLLMPTFFFCSQQWNDMGVPTSKRIIEANASKFMGSYYVQGTTHQWISDSQYFAPTWLLRKIGIVGSGDLRKVHAATSHATDIMLKALLDAPQEGKTKELSAIDGGLVFPML